MSVVIDAAVQHLLESKENIDDARGEFNREHVGDRTSVSDECGESLLVD